MEGRREAEGVLVGVLDGLRSWVIMRRMGVREGVSSVRPEGGGKRTTRWDQYLRAVTTTPPKRLIRKAF